MRTHIINYIPTTKYYNSYGYNQRNEMSCAMNEICLYRMTSHYDLFLLSGNVQVPTADALGHYLNHSRVKIKHIIYTILSDVRQSLDACELNTKYTSMVQDIYHHTYILYCRF